MLGCGSLRLHLRQPALAVRRLRAGRNSLALGEATLLARYESSLGRMYCVDKEMNFTYYNLNLSLLEYQCAMVRKDFATAEMHFEQIPEALHTRVARYVYILTPS